MIIFLYGQNSYSLIEYINQLIERYKNKYPDSFNLHRFDLEEDDINETENAIKGASFFKQIKFIIIKSPVAKASFVEKIIKMSNATSEKDIVLLLYQNISAEELKNKNEKFFEFLKKSGEAKEFKPPTAQAAMKFALDHLSKHKVVIKKDILAKLIKETGQDLWRLRNELDKIISFAQNGEVEEKNLVKLVNFKTDQNIFSIIDAAFSNQSRALVLFENYLTSGGDPLYLLSMIAFQLKNMLIVREMIDKNLQYGQMLKKTGMHPFFFKKNYEAAKRYSMENLKAIFQKAADFEIAFKSGRAEAENIFFHLFT